KKKKQERRKKPDKKKNIDKKALNNANKAKKEQERLQRIEENKRKKEYKIALREKRKLEKRNKQKSNNEIINKNIDKETLKEVNRIRKEQEKILKKEQKIKRIEEAKRLKELKKQELEPKKQKKLELKLQKKEEKRKKAEEKIIAKAEIKKLKEKQLIEKIETESKLKAAKESESKRKKENAIKIKKAKLEQKEKQKEEKNIPLKQKIKKWYKNLAFVRYRENKAEMERQVLLIDFEGEDAVRSEQKIYFRYVAKKLETGELERGVFPAFSKLEVHSYLLAEGYEVYEITPQRNYGQDVLTRLVRGKIKRADLVFFLTQLSTFLKSGLPLLEAIKILEKQTDKRKYKNLYKSLNYELTMGENFSSALEKQGDSFPRLLVNMIKSSELSGNLPEVLDDMATYYDEMNKTRKQMKSAMTYPLVIFVFATGVIIFILIFVIPEFVGIYKEMDAELPTITKIIIDTSNFLRKNIFYLLMGLFAIFLIFKALYKSVKAFRTIVQWATMHVAVFGKIIIYNEVTTFTKTFGSLLNHNVFITDSMEVLSKITNNEIYKMLIFDTITNLAKGGIISNAFKNHWAFPVIAYEMLLTGEKTGELGDMMMKVSDYFQLQHKNSVTQIKTFIEPLMIVFLTVLVGIILMSVILPMFNMYTEIM
ncbi:MAG: type II secretion system F family protein, partial [Bacilli bacterium]|nr:type II secretion system F family protein [Bacilli bacterium]